MVELLKDFEKVTIFTGHSHRMASFVHPEYPNIVEYNITSVCGALWNSANTAGIIIGEDGADAGFFLCSFEGDKLSKQWYSAVNGSQYPFRAYDMNEVAKEYATSETLQYLCNLQTKQINYADAQYADYIYVNCWTWEEGCTITISENGVELAVEKVTHSDPLAAKVVYAKPSVLTKTKESKKDNLLATAINMFRAKASSATSPITITFTTPQGQTYTQEFVRPTALL
jgi:hypothetical protein